MAAAAEAFGDRSRYAELKLVFYVAGRTLGWNVRGLQVSIYFTDPSNRTPKKFGTVCNIIVLMTR